MPSLLDDLTSLGGGVFVSHQGIDSKISEAELWRAFEKPVLIWVHGQTFEDSHIDQLAEIAKRFPHLNRFRFTNTKLTKEGTRRLKELCPRILM